MSFQKAVAYENKIRLLLYGATGSGKTYTALQLASRIVEREDKGCIAVIDTEHSSSCRYANKFDFLVSDLTSHSPAAYISNITEAENLGATVIIIDSLTHLWYELLNRANSAKNSFTAWSTLRPQERALIEKILSCKAHIIATARAKTEWVLEKNSSGKTAPTKVGTEIIQNKELGYEFDFLATLSSDHLLTMEKTRVPELDCMIVPYPGSEFADMLLDGVRGLPLPESKEEKLARVKSARLENKLSVDQAKELLESKFKVDTPANLTSQEVDLLINMMVELSSEISE